MRLGSKKNTPKVIRWHPTKWVAVIDPPDDMQYCIYFDTQKAMSEWRASTTLPVTFMYAPRPPKKPKGKTK